MQKRFCSCGHMVLVNYRCVGGIWMPLVLNAGRVHHKGKRLACPSCGAPMNIHTLR